MKIAHQTMILTLLVFGVSWGACLAVAGMFALEMGIGGDRPDVMLIGLGIAGLAAGNFVFMEVVADRLLTTSGRRLRDATEMAAAGIMILALALAGVMWFARTTS